MRQRSVLQRFGCLVLLLSLLLSTTILASAAPAAPKWPSIRADSAIAIDYDTGEVLYTKNADSMMVPASMTKVMTAYIIFEELEAGRLTLDTKVPISAKNAALSRDGSNYPASVPLPSGGTVSVDTLLKLILIPSASASCIVMAEYISGSESAFVQRMNETAKSLGMDANYQNCHGAHVHYLTARSQAKLVRAFIQRFPQILEYTSMTSVYFNGRTYQNTNHLLPGSAYAYPGADGFKTGTIAAAGYCLSATAERNGHRVISVVMHSDNDATRHTDSIAILNYAFQVLNDRSVYPDLTYHWSRDAVEALAAKNVELHTQEGQNYLPDQAITRAEFTAMLYSALEQAGKLPAEVPAEPAEPEVPEDTVTAEEPTEPGTATEPGDAEPGDATEPEEPVVEPEEPEDSTPQFSDISGHWAEEYIKKAAQLGIVTGVEDGVFAPDRAITREAMMVLIDRFLQLPDKNGLGFADDGKISMWALNAVARVTAAGLFSGNEQNMLNPTKSASRGEAATVTLRLLESSFV